MKSLWTVVLVVAASVAFGEASVDRVLVRQRWPWSRDVRVDYEVHGTEGAGVDLAVSVVAGDVTLDTAAVNRAMTAGSIHGVKNGLGSFTFDPVLAFGTAQTAREISVAVTVAGAADPLVDQVEYRVFDLETGDTVDLRRRDFYDNPQKYGPFTTDYSAIGPGFTTPLEHPFVWTGVNSNNIWKTSKLVMKRIPAKDVVWWMGPTDDDTLAQRTSSYPETRFQVKFTKDFFIGVFELTARQHELVTGYDPCFFTNQDHHAWAPVHHVNMSILMNSPTGFCRMATARFGKTFRLPYEAEWEFAAKAGYDGPCYPNGKAITTDTFNELEGYSSASGSNQRNSPYFPYAAGRGRPNAYGLFNMLGNVRECMGDLVQKNLLDYYTNSRHLTQPFVDPYSTSQNVGVEAYPFKGCDFNQLILSNSRPSYRVGYIPEQYSNAAGCYGVYGCRVLCTCE